MKASFFIFSLLILPVNLHAKEMLPVDDSSTPVIAYAYEKPDFKKMAMVNQNEKDVKILNLNKRLEEQKRLYLEKITYLEFELKKSKERLIEKSIHADNLMASSQKRFDEESTYLKKELISKTKTLMEYQRQLEKTHPSDEIKNLIKINTELALEVRRSNDQLAVIQLRGREMRMPASTEK